MKVIIKKTGKIKEVSDGYARNYLFPKGEASPATDAAVNALKVQQQQYDTTEEMQKKEWDRCAEHITVLHLTVHAKANSEGVLFGSLSESVILDALRSQGEHIESSWLRISEPIKNVGPAKVGVEFPNGTSATVNITINAE